MNTRHPVTGKPLDRVYLKLSLYDANILGLIRAWNKMQSRSGYFGQWERTPTCGWNENRLGWGPN